MALTPEEEQRKASYDHISQMIVAATAKVFDGGDEDAAWRAVFAIADEEANDPRFQRTQPTPENARIHLKAKHQ